MKRERPEFHHIRYPRNIRRIAPLSPNRFAQLYGEVNRRRNRGGKEKFLQWYTENKAELGSPLFKTLYTTRQTNEQARRIHFHRLQSISEHYDVSLGLLGGWLGFLNRCHKDREDAIQLTQALLLEIAVYESIFVDTYSTALESVEFGEWLVRNPRFEPATAECDKAFRLNERWAQTEGADQFVAEAKSRVGRDDLSADHRDLKRAEARRLSLRDHDLEYDDDRSSIIEEHIAQDMSLDKFAPLSLNGIENTIKKWDDAGRHLGWEPLAVARGKQWDDIMDMARRNIEDSRADADEDFCEILWRERENPWKQKKP